MKKISISILSLFFALFSVQSYAQDNAVYKITFDAAWSDLTHPTDFPGSEPNIARWSPVAGMTHDASVQLFEVGTIASQGIVNISQTGSRQPLDAEIAALISAGSAQTYIESGTRVRPSPDTISTLFSASTTHPYLSLASMIAPSPDWFVGFNNLNLVEDGEFIESRIIQFKPYDSGSDSGVSFASDNLDTQPRENIFEITDGLLANDIGDINSLGVWRIERVDANSTCDVNGGSLAGGPFQFVVDGNADNIPATAISVSDVSGANNQWVVTDERGYILGLPPTPSAVNFDAAGTGLCFLYHLSYENGLEGLAVGNNIEGFRGCFNLSNSTYINRVDPASAGPAVGAVFAMTNGEGQVPGNVQGPNSVVAYGQAADGTLSLIGTYPTGGMGGDYDGGEGLDPLISAYAITKTVDNRFVLAVNAGSNTITSMRVNDDFSLTVIDTEDTQDIGPNSIAHKPSAMAGVNGLVYVSNITRPEFLALGEPAQQGSIIGYRLMDDGSLEPVANSQRDLANRPSAVQFSPNGDFLVVASINAGAAALASGSEDEIVVYSVNADGTLSADQTAGATSTLRGNTANRNLPSAIGFQIVGDNYVVVTEAREFQANGAPPAFPALQDGSVSTWQIQADGSLTAIDLDVASGENNTGRTACWLDFSDDNTFFVSNAIEAGLAAYSFDNGNIELINQVAAQGTGATGNTTDPGAAFGTTEGWIDLWISDDGNYLYQCYGLTGEIGVFEINGTELTLLQEIGGLPQNNVQGIVSVGQPVGNEITAEYRIIFDAAWSELTHPTDFPGSEPNIARWSPVAGMTHNASTQLFEAGTIASQGIVNISQTGSRQPLDAEIAALISAGSAETYIESGTRVRPSPDTISTLFSASSSHPYLSLASMIAPSPDWYVGFNNLNLVENGEFIESRVIQFVPYDSGSDSGVSFASDNEDTQPRENIFKITDGLLANDNGDINSLGIWRIERVDANSNCDADGGTISGGPFTFSVDGQADNIPEGALTLADANGAGNQWVVTDERGYILGLPPTPSAVNFDDAGVGVCFIRNLAYEPGIEGLEAGNNIEDLRGCFSFSNSTYVNRVEAAGPIVGAVFAMTNGEGQVPGNVQGPNSVVAYGQAADGTLSLIGTYPTGGNGGDYDGGEGLDPLISAYAITKTVDNRFVLAVNAGSNTITSMRVNDDFSLTVIDTEDTEDIGPNSVAHKPSAMAGVNGLVYVSNITRPEFLALGEPAQQGSIIGYRLMDDGSLEPVANSQRDLANRPSAVQFSPNGDFLVVASINAGAAALASGSEDEIVVYSVNADGTLSADQTAGATSTLRGNTANRNLPSAIGFQIVGDNYVVVTEAREFQANGAPPAFPALQDGSVSTWQIQADGSLTAIDLDVASGENNTGRTACWLDFSDDNTFFVSNAIEAGLAAYSFDNGNIELINQVAAQGTGATGNTTDPGAAFGTTEGWIDLWISDDGNYLYQCYGLTGQIGVFGIDGTELTLLQEIGGLPQNNVQGIVSVGQPVVTPPTGPAVGAVFAMTNGEGQVPGNVQGPNSVVAYAQAEDGTLTLLGSYPTGGNGGDYDGGEGLDPLISAYALTKTVDNRFILAVNAGSNTVTSMRINDDFSLTVIDTEDTEDIGPNSIAHKPSAMPGVNGLVYVSNISRPEFLALGEPAQQGSIIGYRLMDDGSLEPVANSQRDLANRPSAVQFSPNGDFLVVASINAGAAALASGSEDEIVVYSVNDDGTLSANQTAGATSTLRGNTANRNLPSAIGFQIVGDNYVVVTEAREFQANGAPPAFPALQDGSVSTWQIQADGSLTAIDLDVASGENNTGRTACWLDFSDDNTFFVSNAIEAGLAAYSFDNGNIELINQVAAQGTGATGNTTDPGAAFGTTEGWIDLWISDDGNYLYQCYGLTGEIGVYGIDGSELTLLQEIGGLPMNNVQGIVSVGEIGVNPNAQGVDLSLEISVESSLYEIYEEVDYTITITNEGTEEATNVVVSAGLPDGMVFTDAIESAGEYDLFFEEWTIDALAAGETATLDLTLFTLIGDEDITNYVEVVAVDQDDTDSTPGNRNGAPAEDDEAAVVITPAEGGGFSGGDGEANLSLAIDSDTDLFDQYENVTFTITLTNDGPDAATNVEVYAPLPEGLVYTSDNTSRGDYNLFFETWTIESLESGQTAVLELELFTLISEGPIRAYTEVFTSGQLDPNSTPGNGNGVSAQEDDEAVVLVDAINSTATATVNSNEGAAINQSEVTMHRLYPVPAMDDLTLDLVSQMKDASDALISIYNQQGQRMMIQEVTLNEGFNQVYLNVHHLTDGNYIINVISEGEILTTKRFTKIGF